MAHVTKWTDQLEWWNVLDQEALHECTWELLTSPLAQTQKWFVTWRIVCMFEEKLRLGITLGDFDQQQLYSLQLLNEALMNLPIECNWPLVEWMLFRSSRLDACCVMHKIEFGKECVAHLDKIVLFTFATISQTSQLDRFWTLLEIVTFESKIAICEQIKQTNHSTHFMIELCTLLQKVLVSASLLDAVPFINAVIQLINNKKHHLALTLIVKYPVVTLHQKCDEENDLACVVRTPFDTRHCKTQTLPNTMTTLMIGTYRDSFALGYKRSFLLAFDQMSRSLVWGHEVKNDGFNKLIVNETAVALVPSDHNPATKTPVYELATGRLTAVLVKPHQHSFLSPTMDTWTTRIFANGMACVNAITSEMKYQESKCAKGKITPFAFGFLLFDDKHLRVCYFSQYEMEVRECLSCKLHGNLLGIICNRTSVVLSVYKLQPHSADLQHMTFLPSGVVDPKIVALDQFAAVVQHKEGFIFCNFATPCKLVDIRCEVKCWAHMHASPTVVWIWDRVTKKMTRVTAAQGANIVGRLSFMQDFVHAQNDTVYVI